MPIIRHRTNPLYWLLNADYQVAPKWRSATTLDPLEKVQYPWHRVVGNDGDLGKLKSSETGESQSELLGVDGILVTGNSIAASFAKNFVECSLLKSGVLKQARPIDAPVAKVKKLKASSK
jgi:hypothetical protein